MFICVCAHSAILKRVFRLWSFTWLLLKTDNLNRKQFWSMQFVRPQLFKSLVRSTSHNLLFKNKQFVRCITNPILPPRNYTNSYKKPEFLTPKTVLKLEQDMLPWYAIPGGKKPKEELICKIRFKYHPNCSRQ